MTPSPNHTLPPRPPAVSEAPQESPSRPTVVPFRACAPRRFRRADEAEGGSGAILLFTGVRYERRPEPEAGAAAPQRRWS